MTKVACTFSCAVLARANVHAQKHYKSINLILKIFQASVPNWSQVPGMDVLGPSVHPGTECPLWPNLKYFQVKDPSPLQSPKDGRNPSKSTFLAWTGSQTGWGHWTNYPSLGPVPMYCPRPCPEAWTWSGTLHSRLGQILKIFKVSVPNWSQVPGMGVPGPSGHPGTECPLLPNLKFFLSTRS